MARARNIKPGFFTNDELVELPFEDRLLFIGLWTIADREGRLLDRPKKIRMDIFPGDDVDVGKALCRLACSGFIARYEADGRPCIQIINWGKHQNPHVKEVASTIPAPDKHHTNTIPVEKIPERAGLIPDSLLLIPDTGLPITDPAPEVAPASPKHEYPEAFDATWKLYPLRPGASKKEAFKAWSARLKAGVDAFAIEVGVERYAAYVAAMQTEPNYIKQPATFFGPGEHYKADWTVPQAANQKQSRHSGFENINYSEGIEDGRIL